MKKTDLCPCASGKTYGECCGPIIMGKKAAETAADLMRARYCAYAVGNVDFLYASSGEKLQKEFDRNATRQWCQAATWEGLEIEETTLGGIGDDEGTVRFTAHYTAAGKKCEHHEVSYFKRIDGAWRFIDGEIDSEKPYHRETPKIGRNDPCPCGSGKKYKKCCGKA